MATATDPYPSDATAWRAIAADEVLRRLHSNPRSGLDADEVSRRLERYGHNQLPEGRRRGPLKRLLMQLNNILIYPERDALCSQLNTHSRCKKRDRL